MAGDLYNKSATGTGDTGTPDTFTVPFTGRFTFTLQGASGTHGTNKNSSSGITYSGHGGYAARVTTAPVVLQEGDELIIILAQQGVNTRTAVTDGVGGGSGGATWILKKIEAVTDSRYQFVMSGQAYEVLACAAGGCGTQDKAFRKKNYNANSAAAVLYSLENFVAASGRTFTVAASQGNFNGKTCTRNSNVGTGGYGLGQALDDNASQAGGWSTYSGGGSAGASGIIYGTMSTSFSQTGGTIEVLKTSSVGRVMIDGQRTDPDAITIDVMYFNSASITPKTVDAAGTVEISAGVTCESKTYQINNCPVAGNFAARAVSGNRLLQAMHYLHEVE